MGDLFWATQYIEKHVIKIKQQKSFENHSGNFLIVGYKTKKIRIVNKFSTIQLQGPASMPGHMPGGPPNTNTPGSGGPNRRTNANKSKDMIGPKIGKLEYEKFLWKKLGHIIKYSLDKP
jgi:hypothetical protein